MLNKLCGRTRQLALVASLMALGGLAQQAQACSTSPIMGTVCVTAISYCPTSYYEAAGQALPISGNEALYSLIGTIYGGTATTFNLPDLRGRAPVGVGTGANIPAVVLGGTYGREAVQFSANQLPSHTHTASYTATDSGNPQGSLSIKLSSANGTNDTPNATTNYLSNSSTATSGKAAIYSSTPTQSISVGGTTVSGSVGTVVVSPSGGSAPVSILPPQIGLKHCIAYQGIYPSQP